MLDKKSLVELRGIAQSFDIPDIFQKDQRQLIQAIEMKQQDLAPMPKVEIPKPEYDARLMTKPPSKRSQQDEILEMLKPHRDRGLRVTFDENGEMWRMAIGKKNDMGTMRMPLKTVLYCANKILE